MPKRPATAEVDVKNLDQIIPVDKIPAAQQEEYWTMLLSTGGYDAVRAAIKTVEFWRLLRLIPKGLWDKNFFVYLYRTAPKVKNSQKEGYIDKYASAIDEGMVKEAHGGGEYLAYLNAESKEQLKQITFAIDGPPKLQPGQILMAADGVTPLVQSVTPTVPGDDAISKVIDASARANAQAMETVASGARAAIEMVKEQSSPGAKDDSFQTEFMKAAMTRMFAPPPAPTPDPVYQEFMKAAAARMFAPPAEPKEEKETPISETLSTVRELRDALPDLLGKQVKAAADATPGWVSPLLSALGMLFEKAPILLHENNRRLELQAQIIHARGVAPGTAAATIQPQVITIAPPAAPPPPPVQAAPDFSNPAVVVNQMVRFICEGFDKDRDSGDDIAAALAVHFGEAIENLGLDKTLGNPEALHDFAAKVPGLAERAQSPRWPQFFEEFAEYTKARWGLDEEESGPQPIEAQSSGPQPPAA